MHRVPVSTPRRVRILSLALLLLVGCRWLGLGAGSVAAPAWRAEPLPEWDQAFREADPRWRGGDGICSVALSTSQMLWMFGDSFIVQPDARERDGAVIVRNSLAIQQRRADALPGPIAFYWRETPEGPGDAIPDETGPGWLWPMSGARAGDTLFLFFTRCIRSTSPLGFEISGSVLVRVADPDDAIDEWRVEQFPIPFFRHGSDGDTFFGAACLKEREFLYVYGVREDWRRGPTGRSLLVGRIRLEDLERVDFSAWRFLSKDGWTGEMSQAVAFFDGAATEMSVSGFAGLGGFLAVYTYCGLSDRILAQAASAPDGPWREAGLLYRCPEASWSPDYFCYAGKAHPELARTGDEIVITYAANSWRFEDLNRDLRLYWPRFVRVTQVR
ncbi:MAG: DUF4185 domain-containing protein [bacterium]